MPQCPVNKRNAAHAQALQLTFPLFLDMMDAKVVVVAVPLGPLGEINRGYNSVALNTQPPHASYHELVSDTLYFCKRPRAQERW